jgi:hypothetical protein
MRELTRHEVVAMWLWSAEYARSGVGAIEWFKRLPEHRRRNVEDFVKQYDEAAQRDAGASPEGRHG